MININYLNLYLKKLYKILLYLILYKLEEN